MQSIPHQSLELQGLWRIAWFGKLTQLPSIATKSQFIRTYLRQFADGSEESVVNGSVVGDFKIAYVPIGELARLRKGTLVQNGLPVLNPYGKFSYEVESQIALNYDETNLTVFDRYEKYNGQYIISPGPEDVDDKGENNNLFVGIGADGNPFRYVIPCVEIFRFFYATSSVLANALLTDKFLNPDKHLWDIQASILESLPGGRALLWLRKHMLDADAPYLARFAWDSYALSKAQNIYLYAAASDLESGYERMMHAMPPIQGRHLTQFVARAEPYASGSILINRLVSCAWVPQFKELKWDRDNDGRSNPGEIIEEELPPAYGWYVPKPGFDDIHPPEGLYVGHPNPDRKPYRIEEDEITARFPELQDIPAEKMPQTITGTRRAPKDMGPYLQEAFGGTVMEGSSSESLLGATTIEAEQKERASVEVADVDQKAGMVDYLSIMNHLQLAYESGYIEVQYVRITENYALIETVPFNIFPHPIDRKQQNCVYLDDAHRYRRMVLVAKLIKHVDDTLIYRYLIEIQSKRAGEFSTLVVWNRKQSEISWNTLDLILHNFAALKAAKIENASHYGLFWGRLRHTTEYNYDMKQTHHFIDRIFQAKPV